MERFSKPLNISDQSSFEFVKFAALDGEIFFHISSTEDSCDGGNSMGVILDSNQKLIGQVQGLTLSPNVLKV